MSLIPLFLRPADGVLIGDAPDVLQNTDTFAVKLYSHTGSGVGGDILPITASYPTRSGLTSLPRLTVALGARRALRSLCRRARRVDVAPAQVPPAPKSEPIEMSQLEQIRESSLQMEMLGETPSFAQRAFSAITCSTHSASDAKKNGNFQPGHRSLCVELLVRQLPGFLHHLHHIH